MISWKIVACMVVVSIVIASAFMIPTDKTTARGVELTEEALIELDPEVVNPIITKSSAETIIENHGFVGNKINLNASSQWNLYRNNMIDQSYWEVFDGVITTRVDSSNGKVIYYSSFDWTDGTIDESQAKSLSSNYVNQFQGHSNSKEVYYYDEGIEYIADNTSYQEGYHCVDYVFQYESIDTDDYIHTEFDNSGELRLYFYKKCLQMPSSVTPVLNWTQCFYIAESFLLNEFSITEDGVYLTQYPSLVISHNTYYWNYYKDMFGDYTGYLSWKIDAFFETTNDGLTTLYQHNVVIYIDANTGLVLGGAHEVWPI